MTLELKSKLFIFNPIISCLAIAPNNTTNLILVKERP